MQKILFAMAILAVSACSDDKKKDAPPAGGSAKATGATTKTPPATPTPSAAKLTCDKILPTAMRDKYFAGAKITDNPQPTDFTAECKIGDDAATVTTQCHENVAAAMEMTLEALRANLKPDDLPGVGKAAVTMDVGPSRMVTAWDDDSNCQVTLMIPAAIDPVAFTKELLAGYPIK